MKGGVAVVVDVLRATTVIVSALAAGCEAVIPCNEIDEALGVAALRPSGRTLLAGERLGLPIEGFDLGNSPGVFTTEVCEGKTLVMTTTNGTRALLASLEADRVLAVSFPNLAATVRALRDDPKPVHIVCAGTNGRISLEDSILAGAVVADLSMPYSRQVPGWSAGNDAAEIVSRLWGHVPYDDDPTNPTELAGVLALGEGGKRVRAIGLGVDIFDAARLDRFPIVAELKRDPLRVIRVT
jgi:2-phosphosulfolactate phosphatase